jgi:hypothetical protein
MLSAADERSGDRRSDSQRSAGHDREWRGLQQGARLRSLARAGAEATLHRRQNDTRPAQQTQQQVRAHAIHRGSRRASKARQLGEVWPPRMAGSCRQAPPHHNVSAAALANKLARIAWSVLITAVHSRETSSHSPFRARAYASL